MTRLLFLSDSRTQLDTPGRLPAIERYDDARYRTLRQYHATPHNALTIVILSSRYGVITPDKPIPYYTPSLSYESVDATHKVLLKQWNELRATLPLATTTDLFIGCVDVYMYALRRLYIAINLIPNVRNLTYASGGIGQQTQQLYDWLYS
jgi:hypothetical protein